MKVIAIVLVSILTAIVGIAFFALVAVLPAWLLWNWLMPSIFHLREITFWETLGLLFLAGFFLKSSSTSSSSKS